MSEYQYYYSANWGCRTFMLRLPSSVLDFKTARRYCLGEGASVRAKKGKTVLTFAVDFDDYDEVDMGEGGLSSLVPLRADLARGDLRALYLGWLYLVQSGSVKSGAIEPPVPAGLDELNASLTSLAEFFRIDAALLAAAAESSESIGNSLLTPKEIRARIARVPAVAKDKLLASLVCGEGGVSVNPVLQEFVRKYSLGKGRVGATPKGRSAGQLLRSAKENRHD